MHTSIIAESRLLTVDPEEYLSPLYTLQSTFWLVQRYMGGLKNIAKSLFLGGGVGFSIVYSYDDELDVLW